MALPSTPPITLISIQNEFSTGSLNSARSSAGLGSPVGMLDFLGFAAAPPLIRPPTFGPGPVQGGTDSTAYFLDGSPVPGITLGTYFQAGGDVGTQGTCAIGEVVRVIGISSIRIDANGTPVFDNTGTVVAIGIKQCVPGPTPGDLQQPGGPGSPDPLL